MFLLRGMNHILGYIASKLENFFDDLFDDYSVDTLFITAIVLFWAIDFPVMYFCGATYGLESPKSQQIMLFTAGIEFFICIVLSVLTVIMENVNYSVAYYIRAVAMSFLFSTLLLAGVTAAGFLVMLIG